MGTRAEPVDIERLQTAFSQMRSDVGNVYRRSWLIVGHVENNPASIDVVDSDTTDAASVENMCARLCDDQVMYVLLRLTTTFDFSTTVKFVYIHWVGEKVPFAKKGRFGVVSGSVEEYFRPFHLLVETSSLDDLQESNLLQKLEESSGTRNKIIEGTTEGLQERGFTAMSAAKRVGATEKSTIEPRTVAPQGINVPCLPELNDAIAEVRNDYHPTNWVLAGFEDGDIKKSLKVWAKGSGDVDELKEHLDDEQILYALYRTTDKYDDISTVKFVYLYWIGERVKPLTKGRVSAFAGPVEKLFSPAHVTLSFSTRSEVNNAVIRDKVMASSGSKQWVK